MIKCDTLNAGKIAKIIGLASLFSLAACNSNNNDTKNSDENPSEEDTIVVNTVESVSDSSAQIVEKDTVANIQKDTLSQESEPKPSAEVMTENKKQSETPATKTVVEKKNNTPAVKSDVKKKSETPAVKPADVKKAEDKKVEIKTTASRKVADDDDFEPPFTESEKIVTKAVATPVKKESVKPKAEPKKKTEDEDYMFW